MGTLSFQQTRVDGETVEDAKHGESNRVAQCTIGATTPRIDEVVAQ